MSVISSFVSNIFIASSYFVFHERRKRPTQTGVPDEEPTASGSNSWDDVAQQNISRTSETQPSSQDELRAVSGSGITRTPSESNSRINQDILVSCNALVEGY